MSEFKQRRFEQAVKHGTDADIREAARELNHDAFHREENAEFAANTLREHKRSQVRGFSNEANYDGVSIRTGSFPRIRVEEEPELEQEYHPPKKPTYNDDYEEDEDEEIDSDEDFNDDDEEDWEDE